MRFVCEECGGIMHADEGLNHRADRKSNDTPYK